MRPTSHNQANRTHSGSTASLTAALVVAISISLLIAGAVSSVVRTGATAATATVTGGAAATGASAAALPDTSSPGTVLAISGVFLTLCAAAAWGLLRTRGREHHTS